VGEQAVEALRGVSLVVSAGELVCITGPSGSGKSTLLHLLGGLDRPTSGSVRLEGAPLESYSDGELSRLRRKRLGFVFQFFYLVPSLTAVENVALPLLLDGARMSDVREAALARLAAVGLSARATHRPHQLSGGEQQRVAVARALIAAPALVLADEPTGNLDSAAGAVVLESLQRAVRDEGRTVVLVTHDARAAAFATRTVTMKDGAIVSAGPPP
jgi:putative ABC transport system ATP-binding protein